MSSVKKNFAYQSLYQILIIILPLITAPYIARTLGRKGVGIYSYTNTIAYYFVVFAMLGLEQYGNRCIARVRDDRKKLNKTFSELLVVHVLFSSLIVVLYGVYCFFGTGDYRSIAFIQGLYVLSSVFDINWFFFGIEKFKLTVTRNILIKVSSVVMIFCFVRSEKDLWIYCLIMSGSYLINAVILWKFLAKYVSFISVKTEEYIKHLKPMLILFLAVIAAHVYRMIDKAMLGWFDKISDLGCYEYADRLIRMPLSLITALGTVMLSKMSNLYVKKEKKQTDSILSKSALFVWFMSFALAYGMASISPEFVIVFLGKDYSDAVILVQLLAITIPLVAWNNYVRTQMLIPLGKDMIYTKAVIAGALVNVILNLLLIKEYSAIGATIATILSYVIVLVMQTVPLINEMEIKKYIVDMPFFLILGIIMYFIVRQVGDLMGISIIAVISEITIGVLVYSSISIFYIVKVKKIKINELQHVFKKKNK